MCTRLSCAEGHCATVRNIRAAIQNLNLRCHHNIAHAFDTNSIGENILVGGVRQRDLQGCAQNVDCGDVFPVAARIGEIVRSKLLIHGDLRHLCVSIEDPIRDISGAIRVWHPSRRDAITARTHIEGPAGYRRAVSGSYEVLVALVTLCIV